ncbi:MAG: ABC transporter substrate-binding protein [Actinomycetota bacterium]|nr:ABC transporter substrate-binding protein [Actinomycetota bacterium]
MHSRLRRGGLEFRGVTRRARRRVSSRHVGVIAATVASLVAALLGALAGGGAAAARPVGSARVSPPTILQAGELQFCSDIAAPPLEYYTASHVPTGSDVEVGDAIAKELGLTPVWQDVSFSGIIPALQAGHCDAILSQLYIKPSREKVVEFVPYMWSSESLVVGKGNPRHVTGLDLSLCGLTVATTTGTTAGTDAQAESAKCTAAHKKPISVSLFTNDITALQQLAIGRADVYATTTETAAYYLAKRTGLYEFAGPPYGKILTGIAVSKGDTALRKAIATALAAVRAKGAYGAIFRRFGIARDELAGR